MASCKFTKNLLWASHTKTLEGAIKEWAMIYETTLPEVTGLCICQHRLKNVIYMYNRITKLTIIVGSTCLKKFAMASVPITNKYISSLFEKSIHQKKELRKKGEYNTIDDIVKYSKEIEETLIKQCSDIYTKYQNNLYELRELQGAIQELHDLYGIIYLNDLLKLVDTAIETINRRNNEIAEDNKRKQAEEQAMLEREREKEIASLIQKQKIAEENRRNEAMARAIEALEQKEHIAAEEKVQLERNKQAAETEKKEKDAEQKEKEDKKRQAESLLSVLTCRACLKDFQGSPFRDQTCCSWPCLGKPIHKNIIEHV